MPRKPYPTDLTNEQLEIIQPMLPAAKLDIDLTLSQKKVKSFKVEPRPWFVEHTFGWENNLD